MSEPSVVNLSNSFLAVRLIALHEWPVMAMQGSGPFLVAQRALDPDDPSLDAADFLLTREGTWLRFETFLGLGWSLAREEACFDSAAEVMLLLEQLPPKPQVKGGAAPGNTTAGTGEPACRDVLPAAVHRAVRGEDDSLRQQSRTDQPPRTSFD